MSNHKGRQPGSANRRSEETLATFRQLQYSPLEELIRLGKQARGDDDYAPDTDLSYKVNTVLMRYFAPQFTAINLEAFAEAGSPLTLQIISELPPGLGPEGRIKDEEQADD